jgi:hypothetical protein
MTANTSMGMVVGMVVVVMMVFVALVHWIPVVIAVFILR